MILIALGANLPSPKYGSPVATLNAAVDALEQAGMKVTARSSWYETEPVPVSDQPWFVNGVIAVSCDKEPSEVLATLHAVEESFGRVRRESWEARILDLDLIDFDTRLVPNRAVWEAASQTRSAPELVLPHPRAHFRRFVLLPLCDIAPDWMHPVLGKTARELLDALPLEEGIVRALPQAS